MVEIHGQFGPADLQVKLTKAQRQTLAEMLNVLTVAGLTPPTVKVLAAELKQTVAQLQPLLNLCIEDGLLVAVSDELYFTPQAVEAARRGCADYLGEHDGATLSQLREAWGVTRKYAVPLCELFDRLSVTVRDGDIRIPGPQIGGPLAAVGVSD